MLRYRHRCLTLPMPPSLATPVRAQQMFSQALRHARFILDLHRTAIDIGLEKAHGDQHRSSLATTDAVTDLGVTDRDVNRAIAQISRHDCLDGEGPNEIIAHRSTSPRLCY